MCLLAVLYGAPGEVGPEEVFDSGFVAEHPCAEHRGVPVFEKQILGVFQQPPRDAGEKQHRCHGSPLWCGAWGCCWAGGFSAGACAETRATGVVITEVVISRRRRAGAYPSLVTIDQVSCVAAAA